jgi:predicted Rossmann fold flavoprotein
MNNQAHQVIVIGAGAAGLFAATFASGAGATTLLLEKNKKLGVKILMSGGTRCNITQDTDWRGIVAAFADRQGRFLKFALASFTPEDVQNWFRRAGLAMKTEETGKIFPESDRAIDVRDAIVQQAREAGATILAGTPVTDIRPSPSGFQVITGSATLCCQKLIVTTGGQSFPGCGTCGDGYPWLARLGHRIITPRPALTPLRIVDAWVRELAGVTVPDTGLSLRLDGLPATGSKPIPDRRDSARGSFLFTHRGCSGPAVLNVSRGVSDPAFPVPKILCCDWLPAWNEEALRQRLLNSAAKERSIGTLISDWIPRRLAERLCSLAGVAFNQSLAELGKKRVNALLRQLKHCELAIDGTLGFGKAEVTAGGVSLDEVDPVTMESRLVPGLFLAGEILDVDGPIGGYNFQAAWSSGRLAGLSAAACLAPQTTTD